LVNDIEGPGKWVWAPQIAGELVVGKGDSAVSQAAIAATNGLMPTMFMTCVIVTGSLRSSKPVMGKPGNAITPSE
jgi:hypothetical protein